jgi:hypothetical protein
MSISAMILAVLSLSIGAAQAAERLTVTPIACYKSQYVAGWHYEKSPNIYNGQREHAVYLSVQFAEGRDSKGFRKIAVDHLPVTGLVWDTQFKRVIYTNGGVNPVICARETLFGQHRYTQKCNLEGQIIDRPELAQTECDGEAGVEFDGAILIQN